MTKMVDIDLGSSKTQIRLNGDDNLILELNLADMGILARFDEVESKIEELSISVNTDNGASEMSKSVLSIDKEIRVLVDYIFDAPVSSICVQSGTMLDIIDGKRRFEIIIETLFPLYKANLDKESKKVQKRIESMAKKYKE